MPCIESIWVKSKVTWRHGFMLEGSNKVRATYNSLRMCGDIAQIITLEIRTVMTLANCQSHRLTNMEEAEDTQKLMEQSI